MSTRDQHLAPLIIPVLLIALRGFNTVSKFFLALYTARYLGLADLGVYGLMVAATTILPAFAGLGTSDWIIRQGATLPMSKLGPLMTTRFVTVIAINLFLQSLALVVNYAFGTPLPLQLISLLCIIALLDHLAADANDMLTFRGHAVFSNALFSLRAGVWPLGVIAVGLLVPEARTLEALMIGWLAGLVLMWLALFVYVSRRGRWRYFTLNPEMFRAGIKKSIAFYVKDVSIAAGLYLDRFLIALFLGLELAGVYTFFWSIANVVHNLGLYAVFQPHASHLVKSGHGSTKLFRDILRQVEIRTAGFALVMAICLITAVPYFLPYLNRPLLNEHFALLILVMAATLLRLASDCYNFVLLALHHDRAMAILSVLGVPLSVAMYFMLISAFGLNGAGSAYLLVGVILLIPRLILGRITTAIPTDTKKLN